MKYHDVARAIFVSILVFVIPLSQFNLIPQTISYKSSALRRMFLPYLGIGFAHFKYSDLAEVGLLKIDLKEVNPVILVDEKFNNRVYANREEGVIESAYSRPISMNEMDNIRNKMPTIEDFIKNYESSHPDKEVIAAVPASNVLWNDWFVAYSEGTLYHRLREPVLERSYSVFVVWNDGKVSIEEVNFKKDKNGGYRIFTNNGEEITNKIKYFTFGQYILKDGAGTKITEISRYFDDLRHLIGFPEIRTPNKNLPYEGSLFFGQSELLRNRKLVNKALKRGVIELLDKSIRDNIEPYTKNTLTPAEIENLLEEAGYKKVSGREQVENPGEFYYDSNKKEVYIKFKRGLFSHTAIGITEEGKVVMVSVGALEKDGGAKVEEVAEILKNQGAVKGLLLCNGMDVVMHLGGRRIFSAEKDLWGIREHFSSVILFVKNKY